KRRCRVTHEVLCLQLTRHRSVVEFVDTLLRRRTVPETVRALCDRLINKVAHLVAIAGALGQPTGIKRVLNHQRRRQLFSRIHPKIRAVGARPREISDRAGKWIATRFLAHKETEAKTFAHFRCRSLVLQQRVVGAIAKAIGRPKSTVSRELSRNKLPSGRYSPLHAAGAYQLRRRREALIERDRALRTFVVDRLAEGWTPEQISGWLTGGNERRLRAVSCQTIRRGEDPFFKAVGDGHGATTGGTTLLAWV